MAPPNDKRLPAQFRTPIAAGREYARQTRYSFRSLESLPRAHGVCEDVPAGKTGPPEWVRNRPHVNQTLTLPAGRAA